jgi:hypothetical protein
MLIVVPSFTACSVLPLDRYICVQFRNSVNKSSVFTVYDMWAHSPTWDPPYPLSLAYKSNSVPNRLGRCRACASYTVACRSRRRPLQQLDTLLAPRSGPTGLFAGLVRHPMRRTGHGLPQIDVRAGRNQAGRVLAAGLVHLRPQPAPEIDA